jgi:hypothetical protein
MPSPRTIFECLLKELREEVRKLIGLGGRGGG